MLGLVEANEMSKYGASAMLLIRFWHKEERADARGKNEQMSESAKYFYHKFVRKMRVNGVTSQVGAFEVLD